MKVITTHINADFDTIGAMVGAKKLYPDALMVFPGGLQKNLRQAVRSLSSMKNSITITDIKDIDMSKITTLILVDIKSPSRIGNFKDILDKSGDKKIEIHIYDHHPRNLTDIKGAVEVIKPYGSTTTIFAELIKEKNLKLSPEEATIMLAGIYEDTGRLSFPSTCREDFDSASFLFSIGADLNILNDYLREELTKGDIALLNDLTENTETYRINGHNVAVTISSKGNLTEDFSPLVQKLRDAIEVKSLFAIIEKGARLTLIGRSSNKEVNAGLILKELGGGGHSEASSAAMKNISLSEAKELLLGSIKKNTVPVSSAKTVMSSPAITVRPDFTLTDTKEILSRYNINAVVVTDKTGIKGIITRQVIDKAIYHNLGSQKTSHYMTSEFNTVKEASSLDEVREKIITLEHRGQRLMPVLKGNKLSGVITRTDLIKILKDDLKTKDIKLGKSRNIKSLINEQLPDWCLDILHFAGLTAVKMNYKAFIVGGIVRDILIRKKNLDLDIVIEGDGIKFAREFARTYKLKHKTSKPIKVMAHEKFKTAVLIFPDGFKMDIATARLEYYENPGALPTVELSSLKLDLYRRDFTINSMAVCINEFHKNKDKDGNFGDLIDYFGGMNDLKLKKLRVLHNLSFVEDPTRVLRAVRLSVRYGFTLTKHTENLIKNTVKIEDFKEMVLFRMGIELRSILEEPKAVSSLKMLSELNMLALIDEKIKYNRTRELLLYKAKEVISWYRLLYKDDKINEWFVIFMALTIDLNDSDLLKLIKRLKLEGRNTIKLIKQRHVAFIALDKLKEKRQPPKSDVYMALKDLSTELILFIMAYTKREGLKKALSQYITELKDLRPFTTGTELKKMGFTAGPTMGEILEELLIMRLDGKIKTKKDEREYLKGLKK